MPPENLPFSKVLVANRGEIAIRLIKGAHALALSTVAVFIAEDSSSPHVRAAGEAVSLGSAPSLYSDVRALLVAANATGAQAVLPGYGFVSEDPHAAAAFEEAGIVWIGPRPQTIQLFGLKHTAREAALAANVPTVPGSPLVDSVQAAARCASKVGFPALVKASAGGGGMGQAIARDNADLKRAYHSVVNQSKTLFSSTQVYLERYVERARHIEVQVFGDGKGACVALGDRDCSVQRRRQKVIEEGCAPNLSSELRASLRKAAADLCAKHNYRSAGTVEFILDDNTKEWFFLEVNTRLQVEHGVTELVSGVDIVRWMLLLAGGVDVLQNGNVQWTEAGAAIEARIYAENPVKGYVPCPGTLSEMVWPEETVCPNTGSRIRIDAWAERGTVVPPHYDPMLGKILAWGRTRPLAILALKDALLNTVARGVPTNLELLQQTVDHPDFLKGTYTTGLLNTFPPQTHSIEVVKPGLQSSLQDYPGRVGYWNIGVSPSGPMDSYAMGMANALVGNSMYETALEITVSGPTLVFHCETVVAVTGGNFLGEIDDGKPLPVWTPFKMKAGSVLTIGTSVGSELAGQEASAGGKTAYLAVRGGFDAPKYLGSASTFPTGSFGGLTGSFLSTGDFLPIGKNSSVALDKAEENGLGFRWPLNTKLPSHFVPKYDNREWTVAALNGPHASADFFQEETLEAIWSSSYVVHHATNRLGARLIGPTPKWTRSDGGSAGLHPSNLHDYTYAPGAVNFSGNTPIVLMLDGPSLGGFVCPITVATADLWKVAQASPGEKIRFKQVDFDQAKHAVLAIEAAWEAVRTNNIDDLDRICSEWNPWWIHDCESHDVPAVLASLDPDEGDTADIKVSYRMSGDEHVLVEYGEIELDLSYRLRVHMIMEELKPKDYVKELCPGVRSLLIRYDRKKVHVNELIATLTNLEKGVLGSVENVVVPSRSIELPLAFEDKWTIEAQARYLHSVRPDAPYMPSNVEFVRRINGLDSTDDVKNIMMSAEYMVLGLGDVYLGAPCAVPVDPRHRIVTSKYNPARTYTPEGAVGIGGAYMCIYGMDSPGGYQLMGRTLPIWDSYGSVPEACRGAPRDIPWLLRFFDRVKFFPVTDDELEDLRARYRKGDYVIKISDDFFSYRDYVRFCKKNEFSIAAFEEKRKAAYDLERSRWEAEGEGESNAAAEHAGRAAKNTEPDRGHEASTLDQELPPFSVSVAAGMSASVWAVHIEEGQEVKRGQQLFALESMKVEISIEAPASGRVERVSISKGDVVTPDSSLCIIVSSAEEAAGDLRIDHVRGLYKLGLTNPLQLVSSTTKNVADVKGVFELTLSRAQVVAQVEHAEERRSRKEHLPLFGVPFVVADDVDVEGLTTHVGFSDISYRANASAFVVDAVRSAGAILIGKTKVDQLNVGYTGVEMVGDLPENPVHPGLICGGNGAAAIAVRRQMASFAIVVDRNGKSTLSPALCGVFGLKLTEGLLPISHKIGSSIDCISLYGNTANDVGRVLGICLEARHSSESIARPFPSHQQDLAGLSYHGLKLGLCQREDVFTNGDSSPHGVLDLFKRFPFGERASEKSTGAYYKATEVFKRQGFQMMEVDASSFTSAAKICDETPINYIKLNSLHEVARKSHRSMLSTVSERLLSVGQLSATDLGSALAKLEECKRLADKDIWGSVDALVLPLTDRLPTKDEVSRHIGKATRALSRFPQLVTCMDLCSLTLHVTPEHDNERPYGILVVAPAFKEQVLLKIGAQW